MCLRLGEKFNAVDQHLNSSLVVFLQ
jgi:hypothetical protein